MTTSYPSVPAPPSLAREAIERSDGPSSPGSTRENAPSVRAGTGEYTHAPVDALENGRDLPAEGTRARGSVMIDDGEAPRSPGPSATLGTLAKEDVRAGVAAVKDRVKDCYERGLKIDPALAGVVKVAFTLEGNDEGKGVVTKGEIAESDMNSLFFEACVLKEIAGAEFKAPGGGGVVNVTYPFKFANDPADAGP